MQLQKEKITRVRDALVSLQAFRARLPAIGHFRARDHAPHLRQRALVPARAGGQAAHRRCRCRLGVQGCVSTLARRAAAGFRTPARLFSSRVSPPRRREMPHRTNLSSPVHRSARSFPPPSPARRTNTRSTSTRCVRTPESHRPPNVARPPTAPLRPIARPCVSAHVAVSNSTRRASKKHVHATTTTDDGTRRALSPRAASPEPVRPARALRVCAVHRREQGGQHPRRAGGVQDADRRPMATPNSRRFSRIPR